MICNPEKTPFDEQANLVIQANVETILQALSQKLNLKVPKFKLRKHICIHNKNGEVSVRNDEFIKKNKVVNFNIQLSF